MNLWKGLVQHVCVLRKKIYLGNLQSFLGLTPGNPRAHVKSRDTRSRSTVSIASTTSTELGPRGV